MYILLSGGYAAGLFRSVEDSPTGTELERLSVACDAG